MSAGQGASLPPFPPAAVPGPGLHRRPKPSLAHSSTGLSRFPTLQSIPRPLKLRRRRLRLLRLRLKAASVPRSGHQQASSCYSSPSSTLYYISSTTLLCATLYTDETFPFKHCRRRERPAACPLCLCLGGKSMEADSGFPFHRLEFGCSCNLSPVGLGLDSHRAHRLTLLLFLPLSIFSLHLFSIFF